MAKTDRQWQINAHFKQSLCSTRETPRNCQICPDLRDWKAAMVKARVKSEMSSASFQSSQKRRYVCQAHSTMEGSI